jgi:hypothetical protein
MAVTNPLKGELMVIDLKKMVQDIRAGTEEQAVGKLYWLLYEIRNSMRDHCAAIVTESEPWKTCDDSDCRCGRHMKLALECKIRAEA